MEHHERCSAGSCFPHWTQARSWTQTPACSCPQSRSCSRPHSRTKTRSGASVSRCPRPCVLCVQVQGRHGCCKRAVADVLVSCCNSALWAPGAATKLRLSSWRSTLLFFLARFFFFFSAGRAKLIALHTACSRLMWELEAGPCTAHCAPHCASLMSWPCQCTLREGMQSSCSGPDADMKRLIFIRRSMRRHSEHQQLVLMQT